MQIEFDSKVELVLKIDLIDMPKVVFVENEVKNSVANSIVKFRNALVKYRDTFDPKNGLSAIHEFVDDLSKSLAKRIGQTEVKVRPGKTEASREVFLKMSRTAIFPNVDFYKPITKWVLVPASLVEEGDTGFVQTWLIHKKVLELQGRVRPKGLVQYKVENKNVWRGKEALLKDLLSQLPADLDRHCADMAQARLTRATKESARVKQREEAFALIRAQNKVPSQ